MRSRARLYLDDDGPVDTVKMLFAVKPSLIVAVAYIVTSIPIVKAVCPVGTMQGRTFVTCTIGLPLRVGTCQPIGGQIIQGTFDSVSNVVSVPAGSLCTYSSGMIPVVATSTSTPRATACVAQLTTCLSARRLNAGVGVNCVETERGDNSDEVGQGTGVLIGQTDDEAGSQSR